MHYSSEDNFSDFADSQSSHRLGPIGHYRVRRKTFLTGNTHEGNLWTPRNSNVGICYSEYSAATLDCSKMERPPARFRWAGRLGPLPTPGRWLQEMSQAQSRFRIDARRGHNPTSPNSLCECFEATHRIPHATLSKFASVPHNGWFVLCGRASLKKANLCFTFYAVSQLCYN